MVTYDDLVHTSPLVSEDKHATGMAVLESLNRIQVLFQLTTHAIITPH